MTALFLSAQKISLIPDTLSYCFGDSAHVEIKTNLENNAIIAWSTPQGIIINSKKVSAIRQGKYYVRVISTLFPGPVNDSTYVRVFYKVRPLLRDTQICKGKPLTLDARYPSLRYLWNTNENTQKISIDNPGRYWVRLINGACVTVDTVNVKLVPGSGAVLNSEYTFCLNEESKILSVKVNPRTKIQWSKRVKNKMRTQ